MTKVRQPPFAALSWPEYRISIAEAMKNQAGAIDPFCRQDAKSE
jgi:hypothetical protein